MVMPASEEQVGAIVVAWLEALGADVFQEVECAGGIADIVAKLGPELWIVETKKNYSLTLLYQAMERRRDAHRVVIAAPYSKNVGDVQQICEALGIGLLEVKLPEAGWPFEDPHLGARVIERCRSKRWNSRPLELAKRLRPEHKTHAKAGSAHGGRWTPFRNTCSELARVVREQPGITVKAAMESIQHHYRSAKSARTSIATWVQQGKVDGVRHLLENGVLRLYPNET